MRVIIFLGILALVLVSIGILRVEKEEIYEQDQLIKFSSYEDLKNFIEINSKISPFYYDEIYSPLMAPLPIRWSMGLSVLESTAGKGLVGVDYSITNIQVAGVDEADVVKNDGKYVYVISGNKIFIIDAYPAENAKILSEIEENEDPIEIFINGNRLIVFGRNPPAREWDCFYRSFQPISGRTFIRIYDISDRENPILKRDLSLDASYFNSRMIGDYVYVIVNAGINYHNGEIALPKISSSGGMEKIPASEIYFFDIFEPSYMFTIVLSINTQDDNEGIISRVFLKGKTQDLFVSLNNIYVTSASGLSWSELLDNVFMPLLPSYVRDEVGEVRTLGLNESEKLQAMIRILKNYLDNHLSDEGRRKFWEKAREKVRGFGNGRKAERTVIHRISISDGKIEYRSQGEVPGRVLNQFSMDEYQGYFRIATTTGWFGANHIYVLDDDLKIIGKLEDLAPGERIYSARFVGDRAYLVTFKKIDPLFVIDLRDPENPKVLGKLKIPGYSDYLHPYDENHIIGLGKEAVEAKGGNFAWYQGIKIALFDVADSTNPKEISKFEIGDRGTNSYALRDHKAFLFNRAKGLLVIPILLAEIDEEKYPRGVPPNVSGDYVWQGAYVFDISLEGGFILKGRITHSENIQPMKWNFFSPYSVKRSFYIEEVLYTISDKMVKMNDLEDLDELNRIELGEKNDVRA